MESARLDLASWPIRLAAYLLDGILPFMGVLFWIGLLALLSLFSVEDGGSDIGVSSSVITVVAILMLVVGAGLLIAYLVWWLIVLGRAQTPGKQVVGIRAVNSTPANLLDGV